jgi:N-acyl-D-amino-acid deacylase
MTLIVNGTIVDGTGADGFAGSVVVDGERIVDVLPVGAPLPSAENVETIDAAGCLVTPGFIDCHAHSDAYLIIEPDAPSKISQGVTTEINGQCGGSAAPRYGEARLSSDWASILGERLTWRSLAEYRRELDAAKIALNTVQFIGHNTLRSSVMGYAARTANLDDIKAMVRLLEKSLDEGGFGLTTGLAYQPGKYSDSEEVTALARAAAAKGGFYATHMRSEGDKLLESVDEVIELVRRTGVRAEISHLKTAGRENWRKIDALLEKMDAAVAEGTLLGCDRYPFCAAGTDLDIVFPDWAGQGGAYEEMKRLRDGELRRRIEAELAVSPRDWSTVMIGGVWHPENKAFCGRFVSELTDNPARFICEVLERDECRTGAFFFGMSEENLTRILSKSWTLPGSDASLRSPSGPLGADHPHPRAYATMPEFYRRLLPLVGRSAAIARMTSLPARRFGLKGRGLIEKGAYADIAVWREDEFCSRSTYAEPHRFSCGMKAVMVNGAIPYLNGSFTGRRAGRFLERG